MKTLVACLFGLGLLGFHGSDMRAEQHRATRLGHPSTRFAPPLSTPGDLRSRFRDEKLKPDVASILRQWGWKGNLQDLHQAALTAEITDIKIPVGTLMPFMSSRENGRPVCLRNVLWAGQDPAPAFAFRFASNGERYRCVTPKACSNFFLEDLGPEPPPALAIDCTAPAEILAGRPLEVCLTLRTVGTAATNARVRLPIPEGTSVTRTSEGGVVSDVDVSWEAARLLATESKQVCAYFARRQPGELTFQATATAAGANPVQSTCSTKVRGIPAILIELVDLEDPIEVGKDVTYEVRVTNQGSATGTNIRIACQVPDSESFVSASGATPMQVQGQSITADSIPELAPKAIAVWRVVVKAVRAADARFRVELASDQFERPIQEEESTELY